MKFIWNCVACGEFGSVPNPGLPVTSLINNAQFQHLDKSPDCAIARSAEVKLVPHGCVFVKEGTP